MAGSARRVSPDEFPELDAEASRDLPADWWFVGDVCTYLSRLRQRDLKRSTWTSYVSRGQAPAADDTSIPDRPRWRPGTIRQFELNRGGTGSAAKTRPRDEHGHLVSYDEKGTTEPGKPRRTR